MKLCVRCVVITIPHPRLSAIYIYILVYGADYGSAATSSHSVLCTWGVDRPGYCLMSPSRSESSGCRIEKHKHTNKGDRHCETMARRSLKSGSRKVIYYPIQSDTVGHIAQPTSCAVGWLARRTKLCSWGKG